MRQFFKWFTIYWWKHLLRPAENRGYTSRWKLFWCRAKGHPCGCWWYNAGGSHPDYTCKNCGDEI